MRTTLDFSPLFRTGIGFDRVFDALDTATRVQPMDNWPPYDIIKQGDDSYRIVMAVAGFDRDELTLTDRPNLLVVSGAKKNGPQDCVYLHKGIAEREFERRFELADHVKVAQASLQNGLLTIELQREVPEGLKPRKIEIRSEGSAAMATRAEPRQIEAPKAA
jgi:molecular chaperone IbpA